MQRFRYYGLSKEEYEECYPEIESFRCKANSTLIWVGLLVMAFLSIISLCFEQVEYFKIVYFFFCAIFMALTIFNYKFSKKYSVLFMYLIYLAYCLFGIALTLCYPDAKPTVVHLLFVLLPIILVDLPSRILLFSLSLCIIYISCVIAFLSPYLRFPEIYNTTIFFFITNIVHWVLNQDRCNGFLSRARMNSTLNELRKTQEELLHISETDVLTGLKNRRKLFMMISMIHDNDIDRPSGIFMIDLDFFKNLNDDYGHAVGDKFLQDFGACLTKFEKEDDICAFRYGGEEFVILAWNAKPEKLNDIAERIRTASAGIKVGQSFPITASIGYVSVDNPEITNYEKWINFADVACYEAKHLGRNQSVCWNDLDASDIENTNE